MVKAEQGNMAGVRKNLGKARANLAGAPERCRGIDTRTLAADCDRCARHAQANGGSFDWRFKPTITPLECPALVSYAVRPATAKTPVKSSASLAPTLP